MNFPFWPFFCFDLPGRLLMTDYKVVGADLARKNKHFLLQGPD